MQRTNIEWVWNPDGTLGYSWNPWSGCKGVGGKICPYCWARTTAEGRLRGRAGYDDINPFKPTYHKDKLEAPLKHKKPAGIFAVDMGDLFGAWVPKETIIDILAVMHKTPQHIYYLLTKNPARYVEFIDNFPRNVLVGATVDKHTEEYRITELRIFKTKMRLERGWAPPVYISFEPMLTPMGQVMLGDIDWAIIGGITKSDYKEPGYPLRIGERPPRREWIKELVERCNNWNVQIFMKNNLPWDGQKLREHPHEPAHAII